MSDAPENQDFEPEVEPSEPPSTEPDEAAAEGPDPEVEAFENEGGSPEPDAAPQESAVAEGDVDPAPQTADGTPEPTPADKVAEQLGVPTAEAQAAAPNITSPPSDPEDAEPVEADEPEPASDEPVDPWSPDNDAEPEYPEGYDASGTVDAYNEAVESGEVAPAVDPTTLPPSLQPEAQGKTGQAESDAEYRQRESATDTDQATLLVQRPASEADEQTYNALGGAPFQSDAETGEPVPAGTASVESDPPVTVTGGDYHKPGSPLPEVTERDQDPNYTDDLAGRDRAARLAKYEGWADEDVPDDVKEARHES